MNILVLNCGSSTVKFQIIQTDLEMMKNGTERCLASGNCEKIGSSEALYSMKATGTDGIKGVRSLQDHREAIIAIFDWIRSGKAGIEGVTGLQDIDAVGHRVLHSGELFNKSVLIDDEVLQGILGLACLGPLHQMAQYKGMLACREILGKDIPQTAVFDTSFHSTMEPKVFLYGLPYEYYEKYKIRRYGFHGTSHRYITHKYAELTNTPLDKVNIISLHLGNGSSVAAVKGGKCVDTSMGFTPLEGLLMGTRCGDLDASVLPFIMEKENLTPTQVDTLMNKKSGLLGISGLSSDMRDIEEAAASGNQRAKLALDMFCLRLVKYIGAYFAEMGGADAIVFTGGIGQNSPVVRAMTCAGLSCLGLNIDTDKNESLKRGSAGEISQSNSDKKIWVIPTNEELMIARDAVMCMEAK
ncbi:MAG: acetate/propionate family kinase [Candidatus Bruticola sp.]